MFAEFTTLMDDDLKESCNGGDTAESHTEHSRMFQTSTGTGLQNMAQQREKAPAKKTSQWWTSKSRVTGEEEAAATD